MIPSYSNSRSVALAGSHLDSGFQPLGYVHYESNMVGYKQSGRILRFTEDSFLIKILDRLTRGQALMDLVLSNKEEFI